MTSYRASQFISRTLLGTAILLFSALGPASPALAGTPTTTTVVSDGTPSAFGQLVTFTATVAPAGASGIVTFNDGGTPIGTGTLVAGSASISIATLTAGSHSITVDYPGDATFDPSTTASPFVQNVTAGATTTAVASSGSPTFFGDPVTFTATVTPSAATGTVQFFDGVAPLGAPVALAGGTASTPAITTLAVGIHSITAQYSGDLNFNPSTSPIIYQTVDRLPTTTAVVSSSNPSPVGGPVTFTVTVSPSAATGTITLYDSGGVIGSGPLAGGTVAFGPMTTLTTGSHLIYAQYSGDATYAGSGSPPITQVVGSGPTPTTTTLGALPNPSTLGQLVTFTATVAPAGATGTVTFKDGLATLGTVPLVAGTATFPTSALALGDHSITAVYSGDPTYATSTSAPLTQTVNPASGTPTTTTLGSLPNPSSLGQLVTFTATVTPGGATGSVTFMDGVTPLGTVPLVAGIATFPTSALALGDHSITAVYSGDPTFATSTSAPLTQTVNSSLSTTTTLGSLPNPSTFGELVTFTATVAPSAATGSVTFMDGATTLGTGTLSGGTATFSTTALAVGGHSITAVYGGDATYATSTSAPLTQTVNPAPTTTTLGSSRNPSTIEESVTFTATVAPGGATGTVTFMDGVTTLGSGPVSGGIASFSTTALAVGSHSITAVYSGDGSFLPSTSAPLTQTVLTLSPGFPADYFGDGKTDLAVYDPSSGVWRIVNPSTLAALTFQWGALGDIPAPGDYDGDGIADITAYRPSTGEWFIINSSNGTVTVQQWGVPGDIPMPGDYDGDGKTDIAVYRPSTGEWFIINSSNSTVTIQQWGATEDRPVPGDYDGDHKTDIAVYRPSTGEWFIINSSSNTVTVEQWGAPDDFPVPGDYDGDNKTDIAVFRPSTGEWFIINSSSGTVTVEQWGAPGDGPVPGDYDGDGKTDIAVYRPSTGVWFIINSSTLLVQQLQLGVPGEQPLPEWLP